MKILPLLLLTSAIAFTACETQHSESASADSTAMISADSTNPSVDTTVEDPDPTDTIPATGYTPHTYRKEAIELVRSVVNKKYKEYLDKGIIDDFGKKFALYEYDLNDDGQDEIFVGLNGSFFCGTGGCTFLILDNKGNLISEFSVSDYPILIADTKTNGWKDLIIYSKGNHLVKFNGTKYPSNPSVEPAYKETPPASFTKVLNMWNEPYAWYKF